MAKLRDALTRLDWYTDCTGWQQDVRGAIAAIVERLEPADTQRTVVEPCFKVGPTFGVNYADIGGAEEHNDEGMVRNDDWLAECEREWRRLDRERYAVNRGEYVYHWGVTYADRLIAAAREAEVLRAALAAANAKLAEITRILDTRGE